MTEPKNAKRILVVDDDPAFQESTRTILEAEGYVVFSKPDSQSALRALHQVKPDLILLDVVMADNHDGYRFAWTLQEDEYFLDFRQIPIIMLTGVYSDALYEFERRPYQEFVHVHDLVSKPLTPANLVNLVRSWLNPEKRKV